ncbi:hypothetical protein [Pseudonocardia endophytica]|uniref:Small secreted domain DUF320 n=1 Tax=Pseudonocardia endophytica TaxID=401976 RepID=A0A4R1HPT4_PSEEN|nr:hypothetical protein [Pseudonocardia endophytica]TCK21759.1 hypothetical protein EV378_5750 [Pseudonocardia endophytica]
MAKKHLVLLASVAAALAVGAPAAMAADAAPAAPAIPGVPSLPALPELPVGAPNGGDCSVEPGSATAQSDTPGAVQAPVPGLNDGNEGNCQSQGNDQGNDVEDGLPAGAGLPGIPQ